jgi:hypothetical protein
MAATQGRRHLITTRRIGTHQKNGRLLCSRLE